MTDPHRECPLCGEMMRLVERTIVDRVPGSSEEKTTRLNEWVCPECDYFEEQDDEAGTV
jgi:rubredoxin